MSKQVTVQEAETILERRFLGKNCKFAYPGYDPVYGLIDQISVELRGRQEPMVIVQMNNKRYTCSPDSIHQCLTVLKKTNGHSH